LNFKASVEHGLELRRIDLLDVSPQMVHDVVKRVCIF
jgi:hypothetical protein